MDPKQCHHCSYEWTPRKENPKKCPQCQNSLWRSEKPKKPRTPAQVLMNEAVEDINNGVAWGAPVSISSSTPGATICYTNDDPIPTYSFAEQRRKAEELLRKLA